MKAYLSVPEFFGESDTNTTQLIHRTGFDVSVHTTKIRCDQRKIIFLISFLSLSD